MGGVRKMKLKIAEELDSQFSVGIITDSEGKSLSVHSQPFTDAEKGKLPKKIKVTLEATHTGINRNLVEYTHDGLAASVDSWTKDYNKPVLLNHDSHSDPLGRVVNAEYKQSIIDPSKNCIQLELEITNAAAIERFLDGRYKTFSIGGYSDSATCSVCGKDQMTDGWCGHFRGKKYGDKVCYWVLGRMDYVEVSVVNCPADHNAQAISLTDENDNPIEGTSTTGSEDSDTNMPHTDGDAGILAQIDGIMGLGAPEGAQDPQKDGQEPVNGGQEPQGGEEPQKDEGEEPQGGEEPQKDDGQEPPQEDEKDKRIRELEAQLSEKDTTIAAKDEEITSVTAKLTVAESTCEDLRKQLDTANEENADLIKQNVAFAKHAHKTMCEAVADMQIALGEKQADERDSLVKEYSQYTSSKLADSIKTLQSSAPKQRAIPVVPHPGASQIGDGTTTDSASKNDNGEVTIEDYAKAMVEYFVGPNRHA